MNTIFQIIVNVHFARSVYYTIFQDIECRSFHTKIFHKKIRLLTTLKFHFNLWESGKCVPSTTISFVVATLSVVSIVVNVGSVVAFVTAVVGGAATSMYKFAILAQVIELRYAPLIMRHFPLNKTTHFSK